MKLSEQRDNQANYSSSDYSNDDEDDSEKNTRIKKRSVSGSRKGKNASQISNRNKPSISQMTTRRRQHDTRNKKAQSSSEEDDREV